MGNRDVSETSEALWDGLLILTKKNARRLGQTTQKELKEIQDHKMELKEDKNRETKRTQRQADSLLRIDFQRLEIWAAISFPYIQKCLRY